MLDSCQEIETFNKLTSAVQNAGIPVDLKSPSDSRRDALGFIVAMNHEMHGPNYKVVVEKLIENVNQLATQGGKKAACEVTWKLDQEVKALFKAKVEKTITNNPDLSETLSAISGLYQACKAKNSEQYNKGEPVHFGGVSRDFVPAWCLKRLY